MFEELINYIFVENLLVSVIIIFVLIYIYTNMDFVNSGDYFNGDVMKPLTYTCIILIIGLVLVEFNSNEDDELSDNIINLPELKKEPSKKYKIKNDDIFIPKDKVV